MAEQIPHDTKELSVELAPGTYNLVPEIKEYIENETPLTPETESILKIFKPDYDLGSDIKQKGKGVILEQLYSAEKIIDMNKIPNAVKRGFEKAQTLNPNIVLDEFPVIFLFMPRIDMGKLLKGKGCAFNINGLKVFPQDKVIDIVESSVTHEATHMFLRQMDIGYIEKKEIKDYIFNFLWEEGLTTYMEEYKEPHHEEFKKDREFWISSIKTFLEASSRDEKEKILKSCQSRQSAINWAEFFKRTPERLTPPEENIDFQFYYFIKNMNGPAYHIGCALWEEQIAKGNSVQELVTKGPSQMEEWFNER